MSIPIRVRLNSFDTLYLDVELSVPIKGLHFETLSVVDRKDNKLMDLSDRSPEPVDRVTLGKQPRTRFPLFIKFELSDGTKCSEDDVGPVFAAPTDKEYSGGVRLPSSAIETSNDPEIRRLFTILDVGETKASGFQFEAARLSSRAEWLLQKMRFPNLVGLVFAAATLTMTSSKAPGDFEWILGGIVSIGAFVCSAIIGLNVRKVYATKRQVEKQSNEELEEYREARKELTEMGIRLGRNANTKCGCGCGDQKSYGEHS